ncbi:ABC transporter ATP-binding protein [Roseateles puraquae]|uniref:ABC transporter ATP-binding protein n=1 Tax=Roseateles puraquae TaxID=431059 RepID=A0A254N620_9BURK|nr:ABC transporter ATP-binding protein [Roseateles puraquae]MDG0853442.1 ABC transporter ATP-binding protein [Roseateles puraquae]OWR03014.1 ABC transporter ATP-binding protein [Roseateles puraquae]
MSPHFPPASTPSADIRGLSLRYPQGPAVLEGLDWQLLPGQVVGLLGRNGAGKTTLLEALLGLREPSSGEVQLFGQPAQVLDDATRARIGYVPQHSDLFESFSAAQLLAYFRSFYPRWNEAKVEGLMSRWDIDRDKPIRKLSGGQKQRLSIIRALAHEPDLLVLDEPVASLDPAGRRDFLRELVGEVLDRGATVVFSTHILSDLERVAFNIAFLSQGRIALQAPLDELLEQVRAFTGSVTEVAALMARLGAQPLKRIPLEAGRERVLARLPAHAELPAGVAADRLNLDDLFTELT